MTALELIAKKIDEELAVYREDIAMGKATDFGAYKYGCGQVWGLLKAKGFIVELVEHLERDDGA